MFRFMVRALALSWFCASAVAFAGTPSSTGFALRDLGAEVARAAAQARDASIASGLDAADGQSAVEQAVQAAIATSGESPDTAAEAIRSARIVLDCPPIARATQDATASCPAWVNAALARVSQQIADATQVGPAAGGASGRSVSIPPPPAVSPGGGGGGAGYRGQ